MLSVVGNRSYKRNLYEVLNHVFTFHVPKERTQGIVLSVTAERHSLATSKPKLKRSHPSSQDKTAQRLARQSKQIQDKIRGLFQGLVMTQKLCYSGKKD